MLSFKTTEISVRVPVIVLLSWEQDQIITKQTIFHKTLEARRKGLYVFLSHLTSAILLHNPAAAKPKEKRRAGGCVPIALACMPATMIQGEMSCIFFSIK